MSRLVIGGEIKEKKGFNINLKPKTLVNGILGAGALLFGAAAIFGKDKSDKKSDLGEFEEDFDAYFEDDEPTETSEENTEE